jgi:hypothetical protein
MQFFSRIEPISSLQAHAAEVLQDVASYEQTQDTLAPLKSWHSATDNVLGCILDIADGPTAEPTRGSTSQALRGCGDSDYRQVFSNLTA